MRKRILAKLTFLFLLISALAGCLIVPEGGHRRGDEFEHDGHHEEHHEHFEDRH